MLQAFKTEWARPEPAGNGVQTAGQLLQSCALIKQEGQDVITPYVDLL